MFNQAQAAAFQAFDNNLNKIRNEFETIYKDMCADEYKVLIKDQKKTLAVMASMRLTFDDLIIQMNTSLKSAMTNPTFQGKLASTFKRVIDTLTMMKEARTQTACSCICGPGKPYLGQEKLGKKCDDILGLLAGVQTNFSLNFNLSGTAGVSGTTGTTVNVDTNTNRSVTAEGPMNVAEDANGMQTVKQEPAYFTPTF